MAYTVSYKPLSEEEMLRIAARSAAPAYDEQIALYGRQAARKEKEYQKALAGLEPAYEKLAAQTEGLYERKRQEVADAATARGFGRSSYVTDRIAQSHDEQSAALRELAGRKEAEAGEIAGRIEALYDDLLENQARLSTAKQNQILAVIDRLRLEQNDREMEAMKANADIALRERQLAAQEEQFARRLAYDLQKLSQEGRYREEQAHLAQEEFAWRRAQDALAREAVAAKATGGGRAAPRVVGKPAPARFSGVRL